MFSARRILASMFALVAICAQAQGEVRTLRAPNGGLVPDIAQGADGVWHMTYGSGQPGDGFYVRSGDGGKTFSKPVRLNDKKDNVTCGMERGPRIALGKDGVIHALWLGFYKTGGGAWYTRSVDGGKSFEPQRRLESPSYGLDNACLAADLEGNVAVLWTGGIPGAKEEADSPTASPIILVRSSDNGVTFTKNELLKSDHPASSFACGCCRLEARFDGGRLCVAFRGGHKNLRDPYFLVGDPVKNDFHCVKISDDRWDYSCPMQGIPFTIDGKGRVVVAWMSRHEAFWSVSDNAGKTFGAKSAVPLGKGKMSFPLALPIDDKQIFAQWQEGRTLRWSIVAEGRATESGTVALFGTNRAMARLGKDGHVYVAY